MVDKGQERMVKGVDCSAVRHDPQKSEENRSQSLVGKFVKIERNVDPVIGTEVQRENQQGERTSGVWACSYSDASSPSQEALANPFCR